MNLSKIARYSSQFIKKNIDDRYCFHSIKHTKYVVLKTKYLGMKNNISPEELELAVIAAWSHDLGYYKGGNDHESRSCDIIQTKMKALDYNSHQIKRVAETILATKIPQKANSIMAKCLCDADLAHLASPNYHVWTERLFKEWKNIDKLQFEKKDLLGKQIDFLKSHQFLSPFAQLKWERKKNKILSSLIDQLGIL